MSAGTEFCVLLIGTELRADRALQRHLSRQYALRFAASAADVETLLAQQLPDVVVCEQQLD